MPWLIALRVVSLPATTSRMKNDAELLRGQPLAVDLGLHQRGGQVVAAGWPGGRRPVPCAYAPMSIDGLGEFVVSRCAYSGSPSPRITFVQWKTALMVLARGCPSSRR